MAPPTRRLSRRPALPAHEREVTQSAPAAHERQVSQLAPAAADLPPAPPPLPAACIDSHAHLDLAEAHGLTAVAALDAAAAVNVVGVVQIGTTVASSQFGVALARSDPRARAAVALHPNEAPEIAARDGRAGLVRAWEEIAALARLPEVSAVGETGLDFFRTPPEGRQVQEESFRVHIRLAREVGKPVIVHDRQAHAESLRVLDEEQAERVVFHCFSGDPALARALAERGWLASFAGTITFRSAADLRAALLMVPEELLLVETDAPYLTPTPYRGRPNSPYLLGLTVAAMAEIRQTDPAALATVLRANAERVFGAWGSPAR